MAVPVVVAVAALTMSATSASAPLRTVALDVSVSGTGSVTAEGGIDCGDKCDARYRSGSIVDVTAKPSANETFARWGGDCYGAQPSCSILLDGATRVRAVFQPIPRNVRIAVGGPGMVTSEPPGLRCGTAAAECIAPFGQGQTIRLIAASDPDAKLFSWGGACEFVSGKECELTVGANEPVTDQALATFSDAAPPADPQTLIVAPALDVRSEPAGIDCGTSCSAAFAPGAAVTLFSPNSTWSGGCVGAGPRCTIVVDKTTSVATREIGHFDGSVSGFGFGVNIQGKAGRVTSGKAINCSRTHGTTFDCEATFRKGNRVTLRASRVGKSRFVRWTRDCKRFKAKPVCTLGVYGNLSATAIFRP
jgi:hypothetical protein